MEISENFGKQSLLIMKISVYLVFSYARKMLLHDEIIIFSRASLLNKIKNAFSGISLAISVKIIFLEPGKFENIQKLSPTFKNQRKA